MPWVGHMKSGFLPIIILLLLSTICRAQNVENSYRFYDDFKVAAPACSSDLVPAKALGSCSAGNKEGSFISDNVDCYSGRSVYHTNMNNGLMYANTEGNVSETYTIQMYIKNTRWGSAKTRIIDFSNGKDDEGIYFKSTNGSPDRCIDFFPNGISGTCPLFKTDQYYLITLTRNGQTGVVDLYADNSLLASYRDIDKKYVGKAGIPIYIFRDDAEIPCESGEANFAFLSFNNYYSSPSAVSSAYSSICILANMNVAADFLIDPSPSCGSKSIRVAYSGILPSETGYTFQWDFDGATIVSGSGKGPYALRWDFPGNKKVTLTIINDACGKDIVNAKQTFVSFTDIEAVVDDKQCTGSATLTINPVKGIEPFQYSIDSVNFQASNVFNVTTKDYKVFIKDDKGCIKDTLIRVSLKGTIQVKAMPDTTICSGQKIQLLTTGNVSEYSWSPAADLDDAQSKDPLASPEQTTQYVITATDRGCFIKDTVTVTVIPEIQVVLTPDSTIPANRAFQLNASSPQLANVKGVSYAWSPPYGLTNAAVPDPKTILGDSQNYTVTLSTVQGCSGTGKVQLTVVPPALITLPDAFTPDGDGKNEVLVPITKRITSLNYLRIYNRWGEVIYFSKELSEGWDGKIKGNKSDSGAYVWKMEAVTNEGEVISKNGTVLLIR
jgi:gliding motility-associated-like protein